MQEKAKSTKDPKLKNYLDTQKCIDERVDALRGIAGLYQLSGSAPKFVEFIYNNQYMLKAYYKKAWDTSRGDHLEADENKVISECLSTHIARGLGIRCANYVNLQPAFRGFSLYNSCSYSYLFIY
jgi:hypothetical protein